MLERSARIERFVVGVDRDAFLRDEKTADSVVRNLEVIGEAASRLPHAFRQQHATVPWRQIIGLRHRIVHDYFDVDLDLVWTIVRSELPALVAQLQALEHPDLRLLSSSSANTAPRSSSNSSRRPVTR